MIRKLFVIASLVFLTLLFVTSSLFVMFNYLGIDEPPGTDGKEFDIGSGPEQMRIDADREAEFMVWYSTEDNKFHRFLGRFNGGDRVDVDQGSMFTVYEVSDKRYTADRGRYRGTLDLPVIREQIDGSRTLEYNTKSIANQVSTEVETTNRIDYVNSSYTDYNVTVIGGEQTVNIDFSPKERFWNSRYVAISSVGGVNYSIEEIEVDGDVKEVSKVGQLDEWIELNETRMYGYDLYEWDSQLIDNTESISMELKVVDQNGNLNGINSENLEESDGVFVLFMDSDYYATVNQSGNGYQDNSGNNLGYKENFQSPYGGDEGVSLGVN